MSTIALLVVGIAIAIGLLWLRFRSPTPDFPPLDFADDDPEMCDARSKAQRTISEFQTLFEQHSAGSMVKVPFLTSSGVREFLAADVLELTPTEVKARLVTPPVSHTGQVERLVTHPLSDIADWVITLPSGKKAGGFTMRVMFKKAREQWGELPAELADEEKRYAQEEG
jgi:uncharacterized protein YegJ (DUF2314 family)